MLLRELFDEMDLYGFEDFEDTQKLTLLNDAYFDIVTREPWPFLERVVEFVAPKDTSRLTVDTVMRVRTADDVLDNSLTDLQQNLFPHVKHNVNSVLSFTNLSRDIVMIPERADVIEKNYYLSEATNSPTRYYSVGEDFFVFPKVDADTRYRLFYLQLPVRATRESDTGVWLIPERHHSLVLYGALVKSFLVNDDPQASLFQNMFEQRYQQMRNDVWMRQYDRTERIHVLSDSYDWSY